MNILRYFTAGESHGPALTGILEGLPAGLEFSTQYVNEHLARRQKGHGRGGRMKIETDKAEITGGIRHGKTLGSPLSITIRNKDWKNWQEPMRVDAGGDESLKNVHIPRPGHADYVGGVKYGHDDLRNVLERASARETAARVAIACAARRLLEEFDIKIAGRVVSIGTAKDSTDLDEIPIDDIISKTENSLVRCLDSDAASKMISQIDAVKEKGDTLGGVFEIIADGLPVGLGSYAQWDRRLEGMLAQVFMSLNAIKGVEIGLGFASAKLTGSEVHDALYFDESRSHAVRKTNRSGGIDGGITTGARLVVRAAMKPISTLMKPIPSIDLRAREAVDAHVERSDFCAVAAASVIAESLTALVLADEFLRKFGGDSVKEIRSHYENSKRR